jgi:hypothetical protein
MDAWANSVCVLLGSQIVRVSKGAMKQVTTKMRNRAKSYGSTGLAARGGV